jgi:Zn-dependent protease
MGLSAEDMRWIIQAMIILLLSICVHEFGHALVADKLGDRLPRSQGRVTLNPLAHADPIGTFVFPLIGLIYTHGMSTGFGWGRPVQVNPPAFTRKYSMRTGHMFVAFAGPAMNVLFGTFVAIVHVALLKFDVIAPGHEVNRALGYAVGLNFILFFFNLVPALPLDGGAVLEGLLPTRMLPGYRKFSVYGPFVLMAIIFISPLQKIFVIPAQFVAVHLYQLLGLIFGVS